MVKAISLVTFPLMLGLFVVAPEFIRVVFGFQWEPVIPVLRILCFCGMFQSIETTVGNIFRSQGKSDTQFKLQAVGTFIVTGCILIGLKWGIKGVASFYALYTLGWVPFSLHVCNKLINLDDKMLVQAISPAFLISGLIAGVLSLIKYFIITTDLNILLLSSFGGLSIYFILMITAKQILISKNKVSLNI